MFRVCLSFCLPNCQNKAIHIPISNSKGNSKYLLKDYNSLKLVLCVLFLISSSVTMLAIFCSEKCFSLNSNVPSLLCLDISNGWFR